MPFVKKSYDPLQKRGSIGQVLAISCFHVFGFCFPLGFCIVEGGRTEAILSLLSSIVSSLPDKLTLLVDGGLMNQRLVEWVIKNKAEVVEAREGIVKEDSLQRRGIEELGRDEYGRIFDVGRKGR
ncbi:MAG: hypothetical protein RMK94_02840 [Armatimonadota bacterium]|nr:hypothetical protein [Armatimonadota bacterium]